jgi:uridine kinase
MLSQDSFYRGLTEEELRNVHNYDFDSPEALDKDAIVQCLKDLKAMKAVEVPIYDFSTHQRSGQLPFH